jgi:hypothetical protein
VEQFATLVRCMTSSIGKMEVLFEELNVQVFFSQMKLTDSEIAQGAEAIMAEIQKKLSQSPVSEMKSLLADKLKLLETCKL